MKIKISILVILLLSSGCLDAQNLTVTLTDNSTASFPINSVRSVKFGVSTMILNEINGTVTSWNITDIANYDFDGSVGLYNSLNVVNNSVSIFPNPSANVVSICFSTNQHGLISIDILDVNGKQIQQVYEGAYEEGIFYQWQSNAKKGIYYCRINSAKQVITKPILIQ